MCRSHSASACGHCHHALSRRGFLHGCGAAVATVGALGTRPARAAEDGKKVRVAAVFLANPAARENWPWTNFDAQGRQQEIMTLLRAECPDVEFEPLMISNAGEIPKVQALNDQVDGYFFYTVTLATPSQVVHEIAKLGKPIVVANEFLGGCSAFLNICTVATRQQIPIGKVSTTRLSDLVTVVRQFADLRKPGMTPQLFAQQCERAYQESFPTLGEMQCAEDSLACTEIAECVKRLQESRFLIVGAGRPGQEREFLGAQARYIDFDELGALYDKVDRDEAAEWAKRFASQSGDLPAGDYIEPSRPAEGVVDKAGAMYLATLDLLKKYDTDTVTMNCLGGFASGKLASYPCLGFMQLLDDGGQGVCEAQPDDTVSMLMARILTGRPGFVSDPTIDTSQNQIVYAHCVATTKPFGPQSDPNDYRIRTLHNRDPQGACAESLLPSGYMTTTFRTNIARRQLVIHRAKSLGALDTEKGCRTKLIGEVCGDSYKLLDRWMDFSWHRVTVFGDVQEPLAEFGKALGLEVIHEA